MNIGVRSLWTIRHYFPYFGKGNEMMAKPFCFNWCTSVGVLNVLKLNIENIPNILKALNWTHSIAKSSAIR